MAKPAEKSDPSCEIEEKIRVVEQSQAKLLDLFGEVKRLMSAKIPKKVASSYER